MKKNLLKLLTLVLALVMVVTVFAGCKKADEETDAPTQGSEETPTETQEQPADEYKPSAAQLLNGKEWGKDYTELYDEIGDKVTIDDVQEDPTTGLAYVEYEGKTYELGMDFLSMAMVYKTAVPENSQYETEDDVYAAWWKYYMTRWNYLLPEIPLYSNEYYDVYNAQIKGVDSTIRTTNVVMDANSKLFVLERLMTDGDQKAESDIEVCMNGSGSSAQIISRSVGKGNSSQVFHPKAVGKNKCHAHIQCDSIIMDHAQVGSIPEIQAKHVDAAIIHEAAIGRINDEQLLKLRTLGMTEAEAENVIIENFLS